MRGEGELFLDLRGLNSIVDSKWFFFVYFIGRGYSFCCLGLSCVFIGRFWSYYRGVNMCFFGFFVYF